MKNLIFVLSFISYNYCSAQTYTWAATDTSFRVSNIARTCMTKDASGNLFMAYSSLQSYSSTELFVIKYTVNHQIEWKKKITALSIGTNNIAIRSDFLGNLFISSNFVGSLSMDSVTYASAGGGNMFLMKLNSQGIFQWLKHSTGSATFASGLSVDTQNNIYVTGRINGDTYIEGNHLGNADGFFFYISKFDTDGNLLWITGNFAGFNAPKITTDTFNYSYVSGTFNYTAQFGNTTLTATDSTHNGASDIYTAKIDPFGNWVWAIKAGGEGTDEFADLYMDSQNNLYITGYTESPSANFGDITITNPALGDNYFAAKYDSDGNALWAVSGGNPNGFGKQICADKQGNTYLSHSGSYLSKYDANGNLLWSQNKPYTVNLDMVADDSGSVYITGYFSNSVSFDSYTFTAAQKQMYVAQLYDPSPITTTISSFIASEHSTLFSVYPNPGSGLFTIRIVAEQVAVYTFTISTVTGQTVYTETLQSADTYSKQVDLSVLPKGSYYANLYCGSSADRKQLKECGKIVIQ